jgi:hypothetical protein
MTVAEELEAMRDNGYPQLADLIQQRIAECGHCACTREGRPCCHCKGPG